MLKVSTLTAVGRSQLLALRPGTLSRILSGIQRAAHTVDVDVKDVLAQVCASVPASQVSNTKIHDSFKQYLLSKPHCDFRFLLFVLGNQI